MKLNLSYPQYGSQRLIELDDEKKTRLFYDRRIAEEVPADALGDEWKGYLLKITGGNDKQGFAMKQGVLLNHRTRLLLDGTTTGFHPWKRPGHRKRKSVRGCIIGPDIAVINAIIIKKGEQDLPGLTNPDAVKPSLRGPKRANHIRKLWGLTKEDDVRQFVSRKKIKDGKNGKPRFKSPKIQRLITPVMLHRKKQRSNIKKQRREKSKKDATEYAQLLGNIRKEKRKALLEKRRANSERKSERLSERTGTEKTDTKPTKEKPEKAKPEKTKKTKKEQTGTGGKAKKQKKDTAESSGAKKGKQQAKQAKPAKGEPKKDTAAKTKPETAEKTGPKGTKPPAKVVGEKTTQKLAEKTAQKQLQQKTATEKPAPKTVAEKTQQPPAQKTTEKPAPKTVAEKPAPKTEKPAQKPTAEKPAPKTEKPAQKPTAEKPAQKPATEKNRSS